MSRPAMLMWVMAFLALDYGAEGVWYEGFVTWPCDDELEAVVLAGGVEVVVAAGVVVGAAVVVAAGVVVTGGVAVVVTGGVTAAGGGVVVVWVVW